MAGEQQNDFSIGFEQETQDTAADDTATTEDGATEENTDETQSKDEANEEAPTEDGQGDGEEESEESEESDSSDEFESEEEFLTQFSLPGSPKTLEEAINSYKNLLAEFNKNKREEAEAKKPDAAQQNTQTDEIFTKSHLTDLMEEKIKTGGIDENSTQAVRFWAKSVDAAYGPVLQKVGQYLSVIDTVANQLVNATRDSSWARFKHKDLTTKEELESLFGIENLYDFDKAFRGLVVKRPDLLAKFSERQFNKGKDEGQKKKLQRFSANRRSKPKPKSSFNLSPWLQPDGSLDEGKLNNIDHRKYPNLRTKVVDAYLSEFERK